MCREILNKYDVLSMLCYHYSVFRRHVTRSEFLQHHNRYIKNVQYCENIEIVARI